MHQGRSIQFGHGFSPEHLKILMIIIIINYNYYVVFQSWTIQYFMAGEKNRWKAEARSSKEEGCTELKYVWTHLSACRLLHKTYRRS